MIGLALHPANVDAVVSFYALVHVPLADQRALFPRISGWLRPSGLLLAITGGGLLDRHRALHGNGHVLGQR
jgi:hypothetical protein